MGDFASVLSLKFAKEELVRFVSGHDFSRAAKVAKRMGFSPCELLFESLRFVKLFNKFHRHRSGTAINAHYQESPIVMRRVNAEGNGRGKFLTCIRWRLTPCRSGCDCAAMLLRRGIECMRKVCAKNDVVMPGAQG
jgi:hypothetical protein